MFQDIQPPNYEIKHSPSYWFTDATIVLQVETTQFRVHQSLLSKHFPIFADAFSFTAPQELDPVEQCSVVKMAGDKAEDWENMLMVVYNPFSPYPSPKDYPIPIILSTLRLATKYESDHLRDMAAACLREHIPCTLESWNLIIRAPSFDGYIFDIVDAAYELGFQSILPGACLLCLRFKGLDKVLNGFSQNDGTFSSLSPSTSKTLVLGWQSLLLSAMKLIINRPMTWTIPEKCKKHFWITAPGFEDHFPCDMDVRTRVHASRIHEIADNPARAFSSSIVELCEVCTEPIYEQLVIGREELWAKLPSFFGLPGWNELKDFDG